MRLERGTQPEDELSTLQELAQDCVDDGVYEFMVATKAGQRAGLVGSLAHAYAIK